jgi:hypothetical protein
MNASYFIMQPDGSQSGPMPHAQVVAYLQQGLLRRESLVRRADLAEFFAVDSYPEFAAAAEPQPRPSVIARGAKAGAVKPAASRREGRLLIWCIVIVWAALLAWGGKVGWEKWQESRVEKARMAAEKWKKENLPEYKVTRVEKGFEFLDQTGGKIYVEGTVEEKETKRHPEYGRAERPEVYVRAMLLNESGQRMGSVIFDPGVTLIREGKGGFTIRKAVSPEVALELLTNWKTIQVEALVSYEKK